MYHHATLLVIVYLIGNLLAQDLCYKINVRYKFHHMIVIMTLRL